MSRAEAKIRNQIGWYIVIWIATASLLFVILRSRYRKLYSDEKYEALITTVSKRRLPAADPCQYFINGDPVTSEGNFAKVIFYCDARRSAVNSVDLTVLKHNSYRELLTETARINGFPVEPILDGPNWRCFDDEEGIADFGQEIKVRSRVECFYEKK